ncbi:MAG: hypothetical protein VW378_04320 [bacterium]
MINRPYYFSSLYEGALLCLRYFFYSYFLLCISVFFLLFAKTTLAVTPSPLYVQVITPTAAIQLNAFELSKVIYETEKGASFVMSGESFFFYEITLANNQKAWIDKTFVALTKTPSEILTPSLIRLPQHSHYSYVPSHVYVDPPDYQNKQIQNLNIDGFYTINFSGRDYNPKNTLDPRWQIIKSDPLYTKFPADVLLGPLKREDSFKFSLDSHISKDLYLYFDIESIPDFRSRWDVRLHLKENKLAFGAIDAQFNNGSYSNLKKSIDGVKYQRETDLYAFTLANGKQRSNPQKVSFMGDGGKNYSLQHSSILRGTVKVWVDNNLQTEGLDGDYTLNYYTGRISFTSIKTITNVIEIVYEFTNPIEDFLPILNRKEFTGFQASFNTLRPEKKEAVVVDYREVIPSRSIQAGFFLTKHRPLIFDSDSLTFPNKDLQRNHHYVMNYDSGKITFLTPITSTHNLSLRYQFHKNDATTDYYVGKDSPGPFQLTHPDIIRSSLSVYVAGKRVKEIKDYLILDNDNGFYEIIFNYPISFPQLISVAYNYRINTLIPAQKSKEQFTLGVNVFEEKIHNNETSLIGTVEEPAIVSQNTIYASRVPLTELAYFQVSYLNNVVSHNITDAYRGIITVNDASLNGKSVSLRYKYKRSETAFLSFTANKASHTYEIDKYHYSNFLNPIQYLGIRKVTVRDIELDPGDYSVEWSQDGQSFTITFLQYNVDTNTAPQTQVLLGDKIDIHYNYTPDVAVTGLLQHRQFGFTIGTQLTDRWRVDGEIAAAQNNFSRKISFVSETLLASSASSFSLSKGPVKENSDSVFLNTGTSDFPIWIPVNQNEYYLNYNTGQLIFHSTVAPNTMIKVEYDYFLSQDSVVPGTNPMSYAKKIALSYDNSILNSHLSYQHIDIDYKPLSQISERNGSRLLRSQSTWEISSQNRIEATYSHSSQEQKYYEPVIQHDFFTKSTLKLFQYIDVDASLTYHSEKEKYIIPVSEERYRQDSLSYSINDTFSVGPKFFRTTYANSYAYSKNNYIDNINVDTTLSYAHDISSTLSLDDLAFLGPFTFTPSFYMSILKTKKPSYTYASLQKKLNQSYSASFSPLRSWRNNVSYTAENTSQKNESKELLHDNYATNYHFSSSFSPVSWFSSDLSTYHKEAFSKLSHTQSLIQDTYSVGISSFKPIGVLRLLRLRDTHFLRRALAYTYGSATFSNDVSKQKDSLILNTNSIQRYTLSSIELLKNAVLKSVSYGLTDQHYKTLEASSSYQTSSTDSHLKNYAFSFSYFPTYRWLNRFNYSIFYKHNTQTSLGKDVYENANYKLVETDTPLFENKQTFRLNSIPLHFWGLGYVSTFEASYALDSRYTRNETSVNYRHPSNSLDPYQQFDNLLSTSHSVTSQFSRYFRRYKFGNVTYSTIFERSISEQLNSLSYSFSPNKNTESSDFRYKHSGSHTISMKPFSQFDLTSKYQYSSEDNTVHTTSTFKTFLDQNTFSISSVFPVFWSLSLNTGFQENYLLQYRGSAKHLSKNDLYQAYLDTYNGTFRNYFIERLLKDTQTYSVGLTYTFSSILNLTGTHSQTYTLNRHRTLNSNSDLNFLIIKESLLTKFSPLKALDIVSEFSLNYSKNKTLNQQIFQKGYQHVLSVSYSPIKTRYFNVNLSYSKSNNWGQLINNNEQEGDEVLEGHTTATSITKQNNSQEIGQLSVNITYPFHKTPHIDKLTITGEGYIKRKSDRYETLYNYDLSGLTLELKLHL